MSGEGRVDFLIAGVQKGGTSALFEYLRDHPGLQMPAVKEAHFFDEEERVDWARPDYAAYHALFADDARMRGEATPIYLYWPNCLERIATYNPAMKLILLFRDPVERAWSQWKMEYGKRKEREPFQWCIREGRARLDHGDPRAPGHHRVFSYVERGFYGRQVEHLLTLFPPEQCLFLRSEDLDRAPERILAEVCAFLDIPALRNVTPKRVHVTGGGPYPSTLEGDDVALMRELYTADIQHFSNLTGLDVDAWRLNWSRKIDRHHD